MAGDSRRLANPPDPHYSRHCQLNRSDRGPGRTGMPPYAPVACELVTEGHPSRKKPSDVDTLTAFDPAELGRVVDARVRELTDLKRRHETGGMDHDDIAHKI